MRIYFLTIRWDYGGVANYIRSFASALAKKHEVHIIVNGEEVDIYHVESIWVATEKSRNKFRKIIRDVMSLFKHDKIDIIHVNSMFDLISAFPYRAPRVWSLHGHDFIGPVSYTSGKQKDSLKVSNGIKHVMVRFISKRADTYLANSSYIKHLFESHYKREALLLHPGLDIEKYADKGDGGYVLFVGRLVEGKGADVLIEAMNGLPYQCKIVGNGAEKKRLIKKPTKNVIFLGSLPPVISSEGHKLREIYANASVVVVPSTFPEPLGFTCLEGLASGKPVIASKIGGIPDCVNEENGVLVRPNNVNQLRKAIVRLMEDKNLRRKLGRNGRRFVEENFNIKNQTAKLEKIYESAINKKGYIR